MAYDYTREALLQPETFPVFADVDAVGPFEPDADGLSLVNAYWLANIAQLSYFDEDDMVRELPRAGLELIAFFSDHAGHEATGTQACLVRGTGFAVLAFRGTESDRKEDLVADLKFRTEPLDGGPRVHRGFLEALDGVWTDMRPHLDSLEDAGTPVWFTGHSLGAGLAILAAARRAPQALYTFGSPRSGRGALAARLRGFRHERFVNCSDLVTKVPPVWIGYRHVGRQQFFDHEGRLSTDPGGWTVFRKRLRAAGAYRKMLPIRQGWLAARNLADHALYNYLESLRRALG